MLDRARHKAPDTAPTTAALDSGGEARPAPRRRLRDRLVEREGTANPVLRGRYELSNVLMLVDDDLRETALALGGIEGFLAEALRLIDSDEVTAAELGRLARDQEIVERLETLEDTLGSLRRRLASMAANLR